MRYPPADFILEPWADYGTYLAPVPESGVGMALLMHIDEEARISGPFRISLSGSAPLHVEFPAQKAVAMGGADAYKLVAEILPKDIVIRPNMITSEWWDLDER
jgi:hypothetical protein